ncbi:MAG: chemotaxis protein CheW, partial [Candidatus Methylomirabilales bacterium]
EIFNLIFLPGFSTAETVTSTSGRGIGMDVVKAAVERLKGSIRGDSQVGRGTRFTLRLPLTLAVIKAMLFEAEGQLFAIPLSSLVEIARVFPSEISTVDGKEVVRLRDRVISLIRLSHVLNLPAPSPQPPAPKTGKAFILVIGLGEKRIALLVERLVGEQELVIKTLDAGWIPTGLLAGASILGDGKVVLILDPAAFLEKAIRREKMRRQGLGVKS